MRALLFAAALLLPTSAVADDLRAARGLAKDLLKSTLSENPARAREDIQAMAEAVKALEAATDRWTEEHSGVDAARAVFALAEGMFGMGRAVLRGACPKSLNEAQCGVYRTALASKALPLLLRADDLRAVAAGAEGWSRKEERRLTGLEEGLAGAVATARERGAKEKPKKRDGLWVAVRHGAWYFGGGTKARETGWPAPQLRTPDRLLLLDDGIAESGRVRVASVPYEKGHCLQRGPVGGAWELELEVDVADLAWVNHVPLKETFEDGTSYDLPPGVSLDPSFRPVSRNVVVPFAATMEQRARAWRSTGIHVPDDGSADWMPIEIPLTMDGEPVPIHDDGPEIPLDAVETEDGETLVTFETVCGTVKARLGGELPPKEGGGGGMGGLLGSLNPGERVRLAAGEVWWPDGSRAGTLTEARTFTPAEVASNEGRSCVEVRLGYLYYPDGVPEDGALTVCVPDERVTPAERQPSLDDLLKKAE